ncbi:beta-galactosidase [Amphibacillus xylanus]|uniref:Beta-galactosidase n=1 Tax=Amphibacillus xylanus (strain ATCC 51415 / DSM 6626 / JCM 7361 / LMG 17667 / NBRC 15112 / Ep01) TaxID=698758 RepID=K0J585_AMPXN|nr:beta-galactosidase [Amphibacillus xylanus]BAM48066.1 beta-galactosidase [Amphibacillus xylanus NBRC 15112]
MREMFKPLSEKLSKMLHGADYNPEQWLDYPEVFEEDLRLMKLANVNVMSIGMFSWGKLEPEEGVFDFSWMDHVIDRLHENGVAVFLSTPSGARPTWMSEKYPEVLRVSANRVRNLHGMRHNHCYTSPIYREKISIINRQLAERYADHPGIVGWHISNEYGGDCHCDHCQKAFRKWVKNKYQTLDKLNHAWWTTFWSHTYTSWSQVESPAPHGETMVHGQNLDWKRFVTDQTIDFYLHELQPLKDKNPDIPATANFMVLYDGLNYDKFAQVVDFISWDSYPTWHEAEDERRIAAFTAMNHDWFRSMKNGQPFYLMESTPSATNWQDMSKLKKPGMHLLSSIQAVAHGSNSVQYFQWRKSRGSSEKFHGAVVDHYGGEKTRVFKDVAEVGRVLAELNELITASVKPEVAIIFDTENRWAVNDAQGPRNIGIHYERTVLEHYQAFWEQGIPVDVISMERDLLQYKLVIAPMVYMTSEDFGKRVESFVEAGGTFVTTYWSGIVNETDLTYLTGFPGPLRHVLGIWSEEIDGLYDHETNYIQFDQNNHLGLAGEYEVRDLCEIIHLEDAEALAYYGKDFYQGRPALTVNQFGKGKAYYMAARQNLAFHRDFYKRLLAETGIEPVINQSLPEGVSVTARSNQTTDFVFLMNFNNRETKVMLDKKEYQNILTKAQVSNQVTLAAFGVEILKRKRK